MSSATTHHAVSSLAEIACVPSLSRRIAEFCQSRLGDFIVFGIVARRIDSDGRGSKRWSLSKVATEFRPLSMSVNDVRVRGLVETDPLQSTLRGVWGSDRSSLFSLFRAIKDSELNASNGESHVVACIIGVDRALVCLDDRELAKMNAFVAKAWCDVHTAADTRTDGWVFESQLEWRSSKSRGLTRIE